MTITPIQGEVWTVDLQGAMGNEVGDKVSALVISNNSFNFSKSDFVICVPMTDRDLLPSLHVPVLQESEDNLSQLFFAMCEQMRSVTKQVGERLSDKVGSVANEDITLVSMKIADLIARKNGPLQLSIFYFDPDPTKGYEIQKKRPALVISNKEIHQDRDTDAREMRIIVPITSKYHDYPTRLEINGLPKTSYLICEQVRAISNCRLSYPAKKRGKVVTVDPKTHDKAITIVKELIKVDP